MDLIVPRLYLGNIAGYHQVLLSVLSDDISLLDNPAASCSVTHVVSMISTPHMIPEWEPLGEGQAGQEAPRKEHAFVAQYRENLAYEREFKAKYQRRAEAETTPKAQGQSSLMSQLTAKFSWLFSSSTSTPTSTSTSTSTSTDAQVSQPTQSPQAEPDGAPLLPRRTRPVVQLSLPIADALSENLLQSLPVALRFIADALESDPNHVVFVHCAAGVSRSASVVIAHLLERSFKLGTPITYDEAYKLVQSKRSCIWPNEGFVVQLKLFHRFSGNVDFLHRSYKWARLKQTRHSFHDTAARTLVEAMQKQNESWPLLASEDHKVKCRSCGYVVCSSVSVLGHGVDDMFQSLGLSGSVQIKSDCNHMFIEPQPWMESVVAGDVMGTLECPGCKEPLGNYSWEGLECDCEHLVEPAFSIKKNAVTYSTDKCVVE